MASAIPGYTIIGPLCYQGKVGCRNVTCTRHYEVEDRCFGYHCSYCDEPCSSQGHGCDAAQAILGAAEKVAASRRDAS